MIHYNVRCSHAHEFDGWFKDSTAFDRLCKRGLVECPTCGDTKVERALMAPAVATRGVTPARLPAPPQTPGQAQDAGQAQGEPQGHEHREPEHRGPEHRGPEHQGPEHRGPGQQAREQQGPERRGQPAAPMATAGGALPDQMRAMLQRMRAEVEKHCDYVGPAFAEEARKIHRGEGEPRSIYGETTPEQAEALSEDGIEFSRIPWVPPADA